MPARSGAVNPGYYNASPECWSVYTEVLGTEFSSAPLFGRGHQLSDVSGCLTVLDVALADDHIATVRS